MTCTYTPSKEVGHAGSRYQPQSASDGRSVAVPGADPESFGRLSEAFARYLGTPAFMIQMSVFIAILLRRLRGGM